MPIKGCLAGQKMGFRLFVLVGSAIGVSLLFSILVLIATAFTHNSLQVTMQNSNYLKVVQLLSTLLLFLLPAWFLAYLSSRNAISYLFAHKGASSVVVLLTILSVVVMQPFLNLTVDWFANWSFPPFLSDLERWFKSMEKQNTDLVKLFLNVSSPGALLFNLFVVALVPAVGEEFFFRGALQRLFSEKMNIHAAVWFAAVIFSAVHMDVGGFFPRVALGAFLGYLLVWSGSIWIPVIAHFINNFWGVLSAYLVYNQYVDKSIDKFGIGTTEWVSWVGLLLCACFIWLLFRQRIRSPKPE